MKWIYEILLKSAVPVVGKLFIDIARNWAKQTQTTIDDEAVDLIEKILIETGIIEGK